MLFSIKNLCGYRVGATDGLAGGIVDFYFNDQDWSVRQIVVSQHPTRLQKATLLPPSAVRGIEEREGVLHVNLTRAEIEALPGANSIVPVCRQYLRASSPTARSAGSFDPHLRCVTAVEGTEINDGENHLGIVHDFLAEPDSWKLAFLVGRRFGAQERDFLTSTSSITQISFATRRVSIQKSAHWDLVFEARNGYDRLLEAEAA